MPNEFYHPTVMYIDPSINEMGWAIGEPGQDKPEKSGCHRSNRSLPIELRLLQIRWKVHGLHEIHNVRQIVIEVPEKFTYARSINKITGKPLNIASMSKLFMAIGVIFATAAELDIGIKTITPRWKGRIDKARAKMLTKKSNHNEADACLMFMVHRGR